MAQLNVHDFTPQEDRLARLGRQADAGEMTEEQFARDQELEMVVAENRPILDRLASVAA